MRVRGWKKLVEKKEKDDFRSTAMGDEPDSSSPPSFPNRRNEQPVSPPLWAHTLKQSGC